MRTLVIVFLTLFTVSTFAQRKIKVHEEKEKIANGTNNTLVVTIYDSSQDDIEKAWKKLMKDYDAKVSHKKEVFADDATIKDLSSNTMDIYAFTRKITDDEFELIVAVDLGGAYLSSSEHPSKYKVMQNILHKFAVETTTEAIEDKKKEAEKVLEALVKEKENLIKENERLESQIEDYKNKISKNESDIEKNKSTQSDKEKAIEAQQKVVDEIAARAKAVD
jgi:hypothetical protein